jgi:hypothetical protein
MPRIKSSKKNGTTTELEAVEKRAATVLREAAEWVRGNSPVQAQTEAAENVIVAIDDFVASLVPAPAPKNQETAAT